MQKSKNLVEAGFSIFFSFLKFWPSKFQKIDSFQIWPFFESKNAKILKKIKNSKIRPLQVFLIFIYCNYAKNQEVLLIIELCIKFERSFFAENHNFFAFRGSKNEKSSYFSQKMYLEADFWLDCSRK